MTVNVGERTQKWQTTWSPHFDTNLRMEIRKHESLVIS